ncbi:hypothetical protein FSP39_017785 [Pinctada imbricata]|uniref:Uncharacterized protein n=1 Tax=Pinctada imbricata TaxID=66713 RepID=A0AA89C417_PINIB|nr:hypothetical protein FSP39_017785 [Pinctada imbricata]
MDNDHIPVYSAKSIIQKIRNRRHTKSGQNRNQSKQKQKPPPYEKKRTPDMRVRPGAQEEPLRGYLSLSGKTHNGVVATTKDGGRWLIHKGPGNGKSSDTVVTNARHMSSQWKPAGAKSARPGTTIGGLVKAGLANKRWNPWDAKCWDATDGMMKKAGRRKRATC